MPDVVSAVFSHREDAERAISTLLKIGVPREAVSVIARHEGEGGEGDAGGGAADAGKGALTGLGVGAGVGALFGLAALAIPGVGPFIAAGALAQVLGLTGGAIASGAIVGGATGGLAGALSHWGLNEAEAKHYAGEVERGGTYVGVDLRRANVDRDAVVQALRRFNGRMEGVPDVDMAGSATSGERRIPLVEEVAQVQKVRREAGQVGVTKHVETETQHISEPVIRAELVTDTREIRAGEEPGTDGRVVQIKPGETLRIQVVEEELVVRKVPRVTREVVIHARPEVQQVEQDIELRRERVDVHQVGDVDVDAAEDVEVHRA
jgi:uncharacterized protein (TIGR02271 family)